MPFYVYNSFSCVLYFAAEIKVVFKEKEKEKKNKNSFFFIQQMYMRR